MESDERISLRPWASTIPESACGGGPPAKSTLVIQDIFQTRRLLQLAGFPEELVLYIMNLAEYWYVERYQCNTNIKLYCNYGTGPSILSTLYTQTPAIGMNLDEEGAPLGKVHKTVFYTHSADHGSSAMEGVPGTYKGSQSWFDVSIFRQDGSWSGDDLVEPSQTFVNEAPKERVLFAYDPVPLDQVVHYVDEDFKRWDFDCLDDLPPWLYREAGSKKLLKSGFQVLLNRTSPRWLLQKNLVGISNGLGTYHHTVAWYGEETPPRVDELVTDDCGAGTGHGFVSSLRQGDRIAVWARADYNANFVRSVTIDVYFSIW